MQSGIKNNIYDYILICLLGSLAAGNFGGGLQIIRILIIAMFPFAANYFFNNKKRFINYSFLFNVCIFWILYAIFTLIVAVDFTDSVLKIVYILCHMCGMFVLFFLYDKSNKPLFSLWRGWVLMLVITFPFAFQELLTGIHFGEIDRELRVADLSGLSVKRVYASVYFGNLNTYCMVICFGLPFIVSYIITPLCRETKYKLLNYSVFLISNYMIVSNASRGGILVLVICLIFLFIKLKKQASTTFVFVALFSLLVYYMLKNNTFNTILAKLFVSGFEDMSRQNLIFSSLDAVLNSFFVGIGVGNFQYVMYHDYLLDVLAPHNLFIEVLSEFGLVIFILFILVFLQIFKRIKRLNFSYKKNILILGLILLPIISIINSIYLTHASFWLFIASLYAISTPNNKFNKIRTINIENN